MDEQRLILVAEDDEATRAFLLENLAADGFRVAGASSPGEGIRGIEVRGSLGVVAGEGNCRAEQHGGDQRDAVARTLREAHGPACQLHGVGR
jgi:CheY-like chemotaxis protein